MGAAGFVSNFEARSEPHAGARLRADFAQIGLEASQQALHFAEDGVTATDLVLQRHEVVALCHIVLDGV